MVSVTLHRISRIRSQRPTDPKRSNRSNRPEGAGSAAAVARGRELDKAREEEDEEFERDYELRLAACLVNDRANNLILALMWGTASHEAVREILAEDYAGNGYVDVSALRTQAGLSGVVL